VGSNQRRNARIHAHSRPNPSKLIQNLILLNILLTDIDYLAKVSRIGTVVADRDVLQTPTSDPTVTSINQLSGVPAHV
jgi:hypothetical protein